MPGRGSPRPSRHTLAIRHALIATSLATGLVVAGCGAGVSGPAAAAAPPSPPTVATQVVQSEPATYTAKISLPHLTWPADPQAAARVNTAIQSWTARQQTDFAARVTHSAAAAKNPPASLPPGSLTITYAVGLVTSHVASFRFLVDSQVPGQADMTQQPAGLTFDLASGAPFTLSGLFQPGKGYLTTLAAAAGTGLAAFSPAGAHCYLGKAPSATAANFSAWWLSPQGLVLSFQAGIYTAAYCGAPSVTVPYASVQAAAATGSPLLGA